MNATDPNLSAFFGHNGKLLLYHGLSDPNVPAQNTVKYYKAVLDTIGDDVQQRSYAVLKPGGMLVSTAQPPSEETAQAHGVRAQYVNVSVPVGPTLTTVAGLVASGQIKPVVSTVLPLAEIRKAHEMIEGKHARGKIVLKVRE